MPILPNAIITISHSTYSPSTHVTSAASPSQTGIVVHIMPFVASAYKILPAAAMESNYAANADSGTNVVEGDIITSITELDGTTPWPGLGIAVNTNETFRVTYTNESTIGPLQHRTIFIKRERGGGPVY